jgi:hypothetical protein
MPLAKPAGQLRKVRCAMGATQILGWLSLVFLGLATWRSMREGKVGPAARTWFLIGSIFAAVGLAGWFARGP